MASKFCKPTREQINVYFPTKGSKDSFKRFWKVKRIDESLGFASLLPRGYPLILVNKKTQQPLASIHVSIHQNQNNSLMIHRPNDSSIDSFQCIIPSEGQILFTITNLTSNWININLMRSNDKVTEVNPGPILSINAVNELKGYSSYTVEVDQKTNKTMIIHPLTNSDNQKITMNDIDTKKSDSTCFQIFPSVVPMINHPNANLFGPEETEWVSVCTSSFIMPLPKIYKSVTNLHAAPLNLESYGEVVWQGSLPTLQQSPIERAERTQERCLVSKGFKNAQSGKIGRECLKKLKSIDTGSTYATQVTSGDYVQINTCETGIDYHYDKHSPSTIVRFSISNLSEFVPNVKFCQDDLEESYQRYISAVLRPMKIYKDSTCCICLDSDPVDVICTCGHVIHKSCFLTNSTVPSKCPLCRSKVVLVTSMDILN
jgi:hypothetical protein